MRDLGRIFWLKIELRYRWKRIKEKFIEVLVCRGTHPPTLLEDNETIICDRCGKVLGKIPRVKREFIISTGPPKDGALKELWDKFQPQRAIRVRRPGSTITDYGRHMKGSKRQRPDYRVSCKAHKSPEEDTENS